MTRPDRAAEPGGAGQDVTGRPTIAARRVLRPGLFALAAGLAACGGSPSTPAEVSLAGACQLRKCVCVADGTIAVPWAAKQPVRWRETGEAYCEPGYRLRRD